MCLFVEKYITVLKKVQLILLLCSTPKISPEISYKQMDETYLLARYGNGSCLFYPRHKAFLEPSLHLLTNVTKQTTSVATAITPSHSCRLQLVGPTDGQRIFQKRDFCMILCEKTHNFNI